MAGNRLTPEQIAEMQERYSLFDKDCDGSISTLQLAAVIRSVGHNPTEIEVEKLIEDFDPEGNGVIEFSDFLTMVAGMQHEGDKEEDLKEAFRVFDKESNGTISAAELRHVLMNFGEKMSQDEVDELINFADSEGKGDIEYDEFLKIMLSE